MLFTFTPIEGVLLVGPEKIDDDRGSFSEIFRASALAAVAHLPFETRQVNRSISRFGVLRGMHLSIGESSQAKFIYVPRGEIWDVVFDARDDSSTYGSVAAFNLSAQNSNALYVPKGVAHGFLALSDGAEVNYLCDREYDPTSERIISPLSPLILGEFLRSPILPIGNKFIMSDKDSRAPLVTNLSDFKLSTFPQD